MSGHVFITQADLGRLDCDAWLLPTDAFVSVSESFQGAFTPADRSLLNTLQVDPPPQWRDGGLRVWPLAAGTYAASGPRCFLVNVGGWPGVTVDWYMDGVRQFVTAAAAALSHAKGAAYRARPLLALPVVGTGAGGVRQYSGELLGALLKELQVLALHFDVDLALVCRGHKMLSAAQNARRQLLQMQDGLNAWAPLSAFQLSQAEHLAHLARAGKLVLFVGAGVSVAAGLPDWRQLLAALARATSLDENELKALEALPELDRARIIERKLAEQGVQLGAAVAGRLSSARYSLLHSLLAALPVDEVVTTNYDTLFEVASTDADRPPRILPYQPRDDRRRWLLKLHGCVDHPEDIVLTRDDYLRFNERRAALAGIVQAMLMTRHMLFVGFSLQDDNFHRIAYDVRKALGSSTKLVASGEAFGTALTLVQEPFLTDLWEPDIQCTGMVAQNSGVEPPEAARRIELLLDFLLAEATDGSTYLLDPTFAGVLSTAERDLSERLRKFATDIPNHLQTERSWEAIASLLKQLGRGSDDGPQQRDDLE